MEWSADTAPAAMTAPAPRRGEMVFTKIRNAQAACSAAIPNVAKLSVRRRRWEFSCSFAVLMSSLFSARTGAGSDMKCMVLGCLAMKDGLTLQQMKPKQRKIQSVLGIA